MPAPVSSSRSACSSTTTRKPLRASANAAVNPPIPAPAMMTLRADVRGGSARRGSHGDVVQSAFRRPRGVGRQGRIVAVKRGAVWANVLGIVAHVAEHVRMIVWRRGADAHEFLGADLDHRHARIVMKMRNNVVSHKRSVGPDGMGLNFCSTIAASGPDS